MSVPTQLIGFSGSRQSAAQAETIYICDGRLQEWADSYIRSFSTKFCAYAQ